MELKHNTMSVWTEKYRPTHLRDIRGHRRIKQLFERTVKNGCRRFPPVILYGPPGTGKTSLAFTLAQETYPNISPSISTLYLNASDERSIEVIRDRIIQFVQTEWPGVTRKFVIFDEVETMTEPAQASLRALLDDVDREGHIHAPLYMFLCNSLYRVYSAIRSRCVALFCGHIPMNHVREALMSIQTAEGVPPEEQTTPSELSFRIFRGDLRAFVTATQYGKDLNGWDVWFDRLRISPQSVCVWEDGLKRAPFCILIRHVFVWMNMMGMLTDASADFLNVCLEAQDASVATLLEVVPPAWEKVRNTTAAAKI